MQNWKLKNHEMFETSGTFWKKCCFSFLQILVLEHTFKNLLFKFRKLKNFNWKKFIE